MSNYETHKGKLIPVDLEGKSLEEYCKKLLDDSGYVYDYTEWKQDFDELMFDSYFIHEDTLYKIEDVERDDVDEYLEATKDKDTGIIEYNMRFYNGGTCLSEMLENYLKLCEDDK